MMYHKRSEGRAYVKEKVKNTIKSLQRVTARRCAILTTLVGLSLIHYYTAAIHTSFLRTRTRSLLLPDWFSQIWCSGAPFARPRKHFDMSMLYCFEAHALVPRAAMRECPLQRRQMTEAGNICACIRLVRIPLAAVCAHINTSKWPLMAAVLQVRESNSHPFSRAHFNTSKFTHAALHNLECNAAVGAHPL